MAAFVTLDDYDRFVGPVPASDAARIDSELESASDAIRKHLEQQLDYIEDDTVVLDGTGRQTLLLPELPVIEVTEVLIGDETQDDYTVGYGGVLYRRGRWPHGFGNITVTYTHGYETIPADIKKVAVQLAFAALEGGTLKSETIGGYSYTREISAGTTPGDYRNILDAYRLPRIPVP